MSSSPNQPEAPEQVTTMNSRFESGVLPITYLDELSLETLEDQVDRHIDFFTTNQVLDTYFGWLHQQIMKDSFTRDGCLLRQWITSLEHRGFSHENILFSFTDWQAWADHQDPSSRRRYFMIKEELTFSLWNAGSATVMKRSPQSLGPYGKPTISGPLRIVGGGPKITGANDEPVGERKRKRGASPPGLMIADASETRTAISGDIETSTPPGNRQSEPRVRMYTPETIYLDSPSPESCMAPGNVDESQTTKKARGKKEVSNSADSKSIALGPSSTYVCKRCNQEGHKMQHCPTNLDPNFDIPPDPGYRCDFCKKFGDHFATLCPRNKQSWSLNEQRRVAARAESMKTRTRNKPRSHPDIDSYRPGNFSPLQDNHEEFPRRHKSSSAKAAARKPPQTRERHVTKKAKKRHSTESTRPESSPRARGESVYQSRRLYTFTFDSQTDGRLSYENDDFFMPNSFPVPAKMTNTRPGPLEGTLNGFDGLTIHNNRLVDDVCPGPFKQASEEAEDFLQSLHSQFQEAEDTAACVAEMEAILDEVSKHDEKCDPTRVVDGEGQQWRAVTNPPYDKHVAGLFARRYVPIINTPVKRQTAADMMEKLDIKASLGEAGCLL